MKHFLLFLGLLSLLSTRPAGAQTVYNDLESLINDQISSYSLSFDNQFKLAAYTELKGDYSPEFNTLTLDFGALGQVAFYRNNLLFKTGNQVYHLNRGENGTVGAAAIDVKLEELFEQILLLGNQNADPRHIYFVDQHLARKNIEPFDKIFLRHILIAYGRYRPEEGYVEFHTDWLPGSTFEYRSPHDSSLVRKPISPLRIRLDPQILRGYYIRAGGTVYVENVDREVEYATGEIYSYNVAAFKLFLQKIFVQSVQYVVQEETQRLGQQGRTVAFVPHNLPATELAPPAPTFYADQGRPEAVHTIRPRPRVTISAKTAAAVAPLYHPYSWIPMMLNILRNQKINIGDPDVICYFVDAPYFERIYAQLTDEERMRVDAYLAAQP
ncbi:MAG: hypothetical protein D6722_18080 [Bacteroidetes bacterium]|nr:MAG: hypothetical protein D6722_18080 [Bacteroidota bacterium]